jgi:hypothetical protein
LQLEWESRLPEAGDQLRRLVTKLPVQLAVPDLLTLDELSHRLVQCLSSDEPVLIDLYVPLSIPDLVSRVLPLEPCLKLLIVELLVRACLLVALGHLLRIVLVSFFFFFFFGNCLPGLRGKETSLELLPHGLESLGFLVTENDDALVLEFLIVKSGGTSFKSLVRWDFD